jgi:23S rRNA methylase
MILLHLKRVNFSENSAENKYMAQNSYEKPDFWSQKAFKEGYPARSVYKLQEIDQKFGFLKKIQMFWI